MNPLITAIMLVVLGFGKVCAETITIDGSDTLLILNQEWAKAYGKKNPGVTIDVKGGGSGHGIKALLAGGVDIAATSRLMKENEIEEFARRAYGEQPWRLKVAVDGVGIYVHHGNPVTELTMEQLAGILSGRIANWREVGGPNLAILVFNRDRESGTREFVREHVLAGGEFTSTAREVSTTASMTDMVSRNRGGIGYGGVAYAPGAHLVKLVPKQGGRGIFPNDQSVRYGSYPLARPLQFYLNSAALSPVVKSFLRWVIGSEGQEIVRRVGYYPVLPRDASASAADDVVVLTPDTMSDHGFLISARLHVNQEQLLQNSAERVTVKLGFDPKGAKIRQVSSIRLLLGDDLSVPVDAKRDEETGAPRQVEFEIHSPLIADTVLEMTVPDEDGKMQTYLLPVRHFNTAE